MFSSKIFIVSGLTFRSLIPFELSLCMVMKSLSRVRLFATPWTVAFQALQSMGFSRQEYWSGLPFPSPGDLPNPGSEPRSPHCRKMLLPSEPPGNTVYGRKWTEAFTV